MWSSVAITLYTWLSDTTKSCSTLTNVVTLGLFPTFLTNWINRYVGNFVSLHFWTVFLFLHNPTSGHLPSCFRFSQQFWHLMSTMSVLSEKCAWTRADKVTPVACGKFFNCKKRNGNSDFDGSRPHAGQVPSMVLSTNFRVIANNHKKLIKTALSHILLFRNLSFH